MPRPTPVPHARAAKARAAEPRAAEPRAAEPGAPGRDAAAPLPGPLLDQLARQVAEAHAGAEHATLVRVQPGADGVAIGLCALPPDVHPVEALLGHVVPHPWVVSGVVAPGRARDLDAPAGTGTPTTVVVLVGRDGSATSHAVGVDALEGGGEAPVGRIPDLLQRTLGRPTPPLRVPAAEWWRALWLDTLVARSAADPDDGPDPRLPLTSTLPQPLIEALVDEPELCWEEGWGRIRRRAAGAGPAAPDPGAPDDPVRAAVAPFVTPEVAAWMDDGCFGRWLLDALPSVDELLDLAEQVVPPAVYASIRSVARRAPGEPAPRPARGGTDPPR